MYIVNGSSRNLEGIKKVFVLWIETINTNTSGEVMIVTEQAFVDPDKKTVNKGRQNRKELKHNRKFLIGRQRTLVKDLDKTIQ